MSKSLAKPAREALDRHDYPTALRLCDTGLAQDGDNYALHVFRAVALQNLERADEAAECYRLATTLQPEQALAWQGLAALLEERGQWDAAVGPLERLRSLTGDAAKHLDYTKRLLDACERTGHVDKVVKLAAFLRSEEAKTKYDGLELPPPDDLLLKEIRLREGAEEALIAKEVETRRFRLGSDPLPVLREKVRSEAVAKSDLDALMLDWLRGRRDAEMAERLVDRLWRKIPTLEDKSATETLIALSREYAADSRLAGEILLEFRTDDIFDFSSPGPYKYTLSADMGEEQMEDCAAKHPTSIYVAVFCAAAFWDRRELSGALKWQKAALARIERLNRDFGCRRSVAQLRRLEGLVLAEDERYQEATPILRTAREKGQAEAGEENADDDNDNDAKVTAALIKCYVALGQHAEAIALYQILHAQRPEDAALQSDLGWQHYLAGDHQQAIQHLQTALRTSPAAATILVRLGQVLWDADEAHRRDRSVCFTYFLGAAKADPSNYEAFLHLGLYYGDIDGDTVRAEKCLAKALSLNGDCLPAALELSQIWLVAARHSHDAAALQRIVAVLEPFSQASRDARLWQNLGAALLGLDKCHAATAAFQNALKGEHPDERRCLRGLGEGYRRQRRYVAAVRAYERVLELDPQCQTAKMGLAAVHAETRRFEASRQVLLQIEGAAARMEALRLGGLLSEELVKLGCVHEAVALIGELIRGCDGMLRADTEYQRVCWTVLSRACMSIYPLRHSADIAQLHEFLRSLRERLADAFRGNEVWTDIDAAIPKDGGIVAEAIRVSALCQINLIVSSEEEAAVATAWADLAATLLRAGRTRQVVSAAADCAEQAVSVQAIHPALTVLATAQLRLENYGLAQHYYIRALQCGSAAAWLGLAHLYAILGDGELAKQALLQVQVGDDGAPAWLYEALLADRTGEERASALVAQASEMGDARWHALHLLAVLKMQSGPNNKDETAARAKSSLMRRLAFRADDAVAKAVLPRLYATSDERNAAVEQVAQGLLLADESAIDDADLLRTLNEAAAGTSEAAWITAYVRHARQDHVGALTVCLTHLEANLFNEQAWIDTRFWYDTLSAFDGVGRTATDWLRLRITPEVAEKQVLMPAIDAVVAMWGDSLPEDISRVLANNKRFLLDKLD